MESKKESAMFLRSFSSFMYTRLCILFLLCLDVIWFGFLFCKMTIYTFLQILFVWSSTSFKESFIKSCISIRRSLVCGVCLILSFFSPALGIMVGCAYFLMYDKNGIEEVVPNVLKKQFGELLSFHREKDVSSD